MEVPDLVVQREASARRLASEDQSDDASSHVLVDTGEGDRFHGETRLLENLATQALSDPF